MAKRWCAILALLCWLASCSAGGADDPRLLLLVSVDTLRADRIGAYGSDLGLTPHIDRLARESQVFRAAYAPASHTLPSVSALLTGRYPEELGIWSNESWLSDTVPTLAQTFRQSGWRCSAVVSNWVLRRASGLAQGFGHYDDSLPQIEAARPIPERVAGDTTDAALRQLDACGPNERCLLWVHYQDPHGPYTPPAGLRERYLARESAAADGQRDLPLLPGPFGSGGIPSYQRIGEQRQVAFYRAGYDGEVAYLDAELGRLLEGLASRGLAERAVIVFTADHGEALGEDDYWFSHGERLSEAQVRVPLLLRIPGRAGTVRDDLASLVDLHRTLAETLLGVTVEGPGRNLLAPGAEQKPSTPYLTALRGSKVERVGIVEGEFKYLATLRDGVWDGRLSSRDREEVDLSAPAPHIARAMRERLEQQLELYRGLTTESRREPSPDEQDKLEALGYLAPAESGS